MNDAKKNSIDIEINKFNDKINKIKNEIILNENDIDEIIENEKIILQKKIKDEKSKKYNIHNGIYVRYGILPEILTELLNARKVTNAKMATEKDPFVKSILNSMQLAYKITANSLYGQTGAPTSPIFFLPIAASTTAIGRERLYFAKKNS